VYGGRPGGTAFGSPTYLDALRGRVFLAHSALPTSLGRCAGPGQDISIIIMQRGVHQETPLVVRALGSGRSWTNLYASVTVPELPRLCVCVCKVAVLQWSGWLRMFLQIDLQHECLHRDTEKRRLIES
jgi:hypothetical protein